MPEGSLLIVEDDSALGTVLKDTLGNHGFSTRWVQSGAQAICELRREEPDLVLVDLGLPDMDGEQLCREIRAFSDCVVVVLTARREEIDVVLALESGADDYLTKPVRARELLARIRAHLRRQQVLGGSTEHRAGNLTLVPTSRRVSVAGVEIELRPKEFDLLAVLASRRGEAVTRDEIMELVWGTKWYSSGKTLDMHVSSLRRKLAEAGWDGEIVTLRGVGLRLEAA